MHSNKSRACGFVALLIGATLVSFALPGDQRTPAFDEGLATITEAEIRDTVNYLASPALEGRDTPSAGLMAAFGFAETKLKSYGYTGLGEEGSMLVPWAYPRELEAPNKRECNFESEGGLVREFELAKDYSPLPGANGNAKGPLVFLGFGIHAPKDKYDDFKGGKLKGKIAMIMAEEPRHKKLLDGPEISKAANVYDKLIELDKEGVEGVLVVRRYAAANAAGKKKSKELVGDAPLDFGFHHTWATWNDMRKDTDKRAALPAIEISVEAASALLGEDVLKLAASMDKRAKTKRVEKKATVVRFASKTQKRQVNAHNVVAYLEGSDPELAKQVIVIGAHFDHLGMDSRGRLAAGADDNASGSAALLEVAEALAIAKPSRSILIAGFSGEEDGLLGSKAMCENPPLELERMVAMINMDMVGRGKHSSTVVLGAENNKDMAKVLKRGAKLAKSGIKKVITNKGMELWQRSDHYSFHAAGVPVLFFFEAVPISDNKDYHTWRDTPDGVNFPKVTNTAKLVYNTVWLLATDAKPPRESRK